MPKNYNRIFMAGVTALEKKHGEAVFKSVKAFRDSFIAAYKEHGKEYALQHLHLTPIHADLKTVIEAIYSDAGVMGARLTTRELKELAGRKAGGFGLNQRWINAVAAYLRTHLLRFVSNITETMRADIVRILQKAVEENLSVNDTVKELEREDLQRARARVITRTEIVRAANVGHAVGASDTPYEVDKKWSAAKDHRTRHSHRDINGHTVGELETFPVPIYDGNNEVGTDHMLYPGDATAHPSNTINCRCRVQYIPREDANGNLILRRTATQATVIPMHRQPSRTPAQVAAALKAAIVMNVE